MKKLCLFAGSVLFSTWSMAQNPLSVHVLNLENGLPSPEVNVILEEQKMENGCKFHKLKPMNKDV